MPNAATDDPRLEDALLDEEDDLEGVETDEGDSQEGESSDTVDELAELRAEVARLRQSAVDVEDLKRSVGRLQSLATRMDSGRGDVTALREQYDSQLEGVTELIGQLTESLDESVLTDPSVRNRILQAREVARRAAEREKLKKELKEEVAPQRETPQTGELNQAYADALSVSLEEEIRDAGLDPDSEHFDWNRANTLLVSDGGAAVRKYIRSQIRTALTEEAASTRRDRRKQAAGKAPERAGATKTDDEIVIEWGTDPKSHDYKTVVEPAMKRLGYLR